MSECLFYCLKEKLVISIDIKMDLKSALSRALSENDNGDFVVFFLISWTSESVFFYSGPTFICRGK